MHRLAKVVLYAVAVVAASVAASAASLRKPMASMDSSLNNAMLEDDKDNMAVAVVVVIPLSPEVKDNKTDSTEEADNPWVPFNVANAAEVTCEIVVSVLSWYDFQLKRQQLRVISHTTTVASVALVSAVGEESSSAWYVSWDTLEVPQLAKPEDSCALDTDAHRCAATAL